LEKKNSLPNNEMLTTKLLKSFSAKSLLLAVLFVCILVACSSEISYSQFDAFVGENSRQIKKYEDFLSSNNVAGIVPTEQLLRNARKWKDCSSSPYSIAPESMWPQQIKTLQLLKELKQTVPLHDIIVRSVYREPNINTCAGGSARSKHLGLNAIDFDVELDAAQSKALCEFWRRKGPRLNMGLGFYSNTALHIDTSGFRTWGHTHKRESSLCMHNHN
jgi:uncharacterized protein YcbK (DUF882 family)